MKKICYIIGVLGLFISCSDFLDVEPDEQISIEEQLSTREGVIEAFAGIYTDLEVLQSSKLFVYPDLIGGNLTFSPNLSNNELGVPSVFENSYGFNETSMSSDFSSTYADAYNIINQINLLLERRGDFRFFSASELDQLEAELLTARAFTHYQLSLLYAQNYNFTSDASHLGIVYNLNTLEVGVDFPSREDMATTYNLLAQDLDRALSLFTGMPLLSTGPSSSYFTEKSTTAIYARIALQFNDWETAATLANELILTGGYQLTPNTDYINQWSMPEALSENILQFTAPQNSDGSVRSSVSQYYLYSSDLLYNDYTASGDLIALFDSQDIRSNLYQTQRLLTRSMGETSDEDYYFTIKYQPASNTPVIRLSELYLIYAEAQERLQPGNALALERLNDIRERAGLNRLSSSQNILDEIALERRRELALEGHLLYDLKRFNRDIIRNMGCIASQCDLAYPSPFFILPIPESSISINENIVQNAGY